MAVRLSHSLAKDYSSEDDSVLISEIVKSALPSCVLRGQRSSGINKPTCAVGCTATSACLSPISGLCRSYAVITQD